MAYEHEYELIEFCEKNRSLWDNTDPDFDNIEKKEELWRELSETTKLSVDRLKKKWDSLVTVFRLEYNKTIIAKAGGRVQWGLYKLLEFLIPNANQYGLHSLCICGNFLIDYSNNTTPEPEKKFKKEFIEFIFNLSKEKMEDQMQIIRKKLSTSSNKHSISNLKIESPKQKNKSTCTVSSSVDLKAEWYKFFEHVVSELQIANLNRFELNYMQEFLLSVVHTELKELVK